MGAVGRSCRSRLLPGGGPGLIRIICGAGFLFHRDLPGVAGSYCPSAGVYPLRPTGGEVEQVARGVEVPVEDQAAGSGDATNTRPSTGRLSMPVALLRFHGLDRGLPALTDSTSTKATLGC